MKFSPILAATVASLRSCATLRQLKEDTRAIDHDARVVGRVDPMPDETGSVHVMVCENHEDGRFSIIDQATPHALGDFMFLLPDNRNYYLAAIQDVNENSRRDHGEPVGYFGKSRMVRIPVGLGSTPVPVTIRLESPGKTPVSVMESLRGMLEKWNPLQRTTHSMGGLVARRFVQLAEKNDIAIRSLTTISTPWGGNEIAATGVRSFSTPIPCWNDIQTGSPFLEGILAEPLEPPHLIICTETDQNSLVITGRNDGTVSVSSQLCKRAVEQASEVVRIHENHDDVLGRREMIDAVVRFWWGL